MRLRPIETALLVGLTACGPEQANADATDASASSPTDTTGDSPGSSSSSPADTGVDATSETSATGSTSTTSDASSSSTGDAFTYGPDETLVELGCGETGPRAWIEIYPGLIDGECLPPPDLEDFMMIVVEPWDGQSGTFEVGPDGPGRAQIGLRAEFVTGTVTLEVSAPWTLASTSFELATASESVEGTADLSDCAPTQPDDPCG